EVVPGIEQADVPPCVGSRQDATPSQPLRCPKWAVVILQLVRLEMPGPSALDDSSGKPSSRSIVGMKHRRRDGAVPAVVCVEMGYKGDETMRGAQRVIVQDANDIKAVIAAKSMAEAEIVALRET